MKYKNSRSLKILMLVFHFDEGSGSAFIKEIASRLTSYGFKIIVIAPSIKGNKRKEEIGNITVYRYSSIYFPKNPLYPFNLLDFLTVLIEIIQKEKRIHVIYDTTSGTLPLSIVAKLLFKLKGMRIPLIIHISSKLNHYKSEGVFSLLYELYLNIIARLNYVISDKILLAGEKIAPRVLRLGANPNKLKTVHIGLKYENKLLNHSAILNKKEIKKIKNSFRINEKDFVIGWVGRVTLGKGLETLLSAIAIVKKILPNIKLLIIGDGRLKNYLYRLSDELDINDIVLFLGYRDDVMKLLQIMDLFVNLSYSEASISATQLEAMSSFLPSVITPFTELVDNMKEAIIVPFNNAQAVSNAIVFLHNNENLRQKMGQNAYVKSEKLIRNYTWSSCLNGIVCTFEEILNNNKKLI